jgi:hypothetical protein
MPQCQFLFSAIFVFQKSYTGNILGIGRNEAQSSYFSRHEAESKAETERGQEAATPGGGASHPLAVPPGGVDPGPPSNIALPPIYSLQDENPKSIDVFPKKFCSTAAIADEIRGIEVSVPAPYRDGELPPKLSPSTPPPSPSLLLSPMMRRE